MRGHGLLGLAVVVATAPVAADAYTLRTTEDGRPLHWADTDVAFRVDAALAQAGGSPAVGRTVAEALAAWGALPDSPFLFSGDPRPVERCAPDSADGLTDVTLVSHDWPWDPAFAGLTVVTYDVAAARIYDADVYLNGLDYRFAVDPADGRSYDLGNVLTHEVGHLLGLGHSGQHDATMFAVSAPNETDKRSLADDDAAGFEVLYGAFGPAAGGGAACTATPGRPASPILAGALLLALGLLARSRGRAAVGVLAALIALAAGARVGWAAVGDAPPTELLAARAEVVLRGTVVARVSRWAGPFIVTDVTVAVTECWAGRCGSTTRVVRELGGEVEGVGMLAPEPTAMPLDAEIVLFALERGPFLLAMGGARGVYRIDPGTDLAVPAQRRAVAGEPGSFETPLALDDLRSLLRSARAGQ